MRTKTRVCPRVGCWQLQPCPDHPRRRRQDHYTKQSNKLYSNTAHKKFRKAVMERSGGKCEAKINGRRCNSTDRVQAHHIKPVIDGGSYDPQRNGLALCRVHHGEAERPTRRARAERRRARLG